MDSSFCKKGENTQLSKSQSKNRTTSNAPTKQNSSSGADTSHRSEEQVSNFQDATEQSFISHKISSGISSGYKGSLAPPARLRFSSLPSDTFGQVHHEVKDQSTSSKNRSSNAIFSRQPASAISQPNVSIRLTANKEQVSPRRHCSKYSEKTGQSTFCQKMIHDLLAKDNRRVHVEYMYISSSPAFVKDNDASLGTTLEKRKNGTSLVNHDKKKKHDTSRLIATEATKKKPELKKKNTTVDNTYIPLRLPQVVPSAEKSERNVNLSKKPILSQNLLQTHSSASSFVPPCPSRHSDSEKRKNVSSSSFIVDYDEISVTTTPAARSDTNLLTGSDKSMVELLPRNQINPEDLQAHPSLLDIGENHPRISGTIDKSVDWSKRDKSCSVVSTEKISDSEVFAPRNVLQLTKSLPILQPNEKESSLKKITSSMCSVPIKTIQSSRWLVDAAREMEKIHRENMTGALTATSSNLLSCRLPTCTNLDQGVSFSNLIHPTNLEIASTKESVESNLIGKVASSYQRDPSYNHLIQTELRMMVDDKPYATTFDLNFNSKSSKQPKVKLMELLMNKNRMWRREESDMTNKSKSSEGKKRNGPSAPILSPVNKES